LLLFVPDSFYYIQPDICLRSVLKVAPQEQALRSGKLNPRKHKMKKVLVSLLALVTAPAVFAGPVQSTGKEVQQNTAYQPASEWYRDREWDIDLFGTYAYTSVTYRHDRYLGVDHAYGGGLAATYFFNRYIGLGVEGYALDANNAVGHLAGELMLRYPIPGSRFAPYVYAAGGALFNGSRTANAISEGDFSDHGKTEADGLFGGGLEVRLTPHIGITGDWGWNVVEGPHNDFGMVRTGVRFAF
jgi:hypothetical protein